MTAIQRDNHGEPVLALVTEAFLDWPLSKLLDWLLAEAPEIRALEIGSALLSPSSMTRVSCVASGPVVTGSVRMAGESCDRVHSATPAE